MLVDSEISGLGYQRKSDKSQVTWIFLQRLWLASEHCQVQSVSSSPSSSRCALNPSQHEDHIIKELFGHFFDTITEWIGMLNEENFILVGIDTNSKLTSYLRHKVCREINSLGSSERIHFASSINRLFPMPLSPTMSVCRPLWRFLTSWYNSSVLPKKLIS